MDNTTEKFLSICDELPPFCMDYFTHRDENMQPKTRLAYAGDLRVFFYFLLDYFPDRFSYTHLCEFTLDDLESLSIDDLNAYKQYLSEYVMDGKKCQNSASGKKRKLSCIKAFYRYFMSVGKISKDPSAYVELPRPKDKPVIILSEKQEEKMLDNLENAYNKTDKAKAFHEKTKFRDIAIVLLFLGTGLRVSELVSIDDYDVDYNEQCIHVVRKGGDMQRVYFDKTVLHALFDYIDLERNALLGVEDLTTAPANGPLFVSSKRNRLSVRRVEDIIKQAGRFILPDSMKVTPHVLRKTFGSRLYKETSDISFVQRALNHSSPETTARYYLKYNDEQMKYLRERNGNKAEKR